ncbi:MBL fold metallo-hydrolase, partial [Rhodobacteraceae bacterium]|nr:MBL fold metallo-hydrolase [Paracoccaceae bacterium]
TALGFRIGPVAYLPDVSAMPPAAWEALAGIDCWILDALRRDPHPSHSHLAQSIEWIDQSNVARAVLTNMHNDLDYATLQAELVIWLAQTGRRLRRLNTIMRKSSSPCT